MSTKIDYAALIFCFCVFTVKADISNFFANNIDPYSQQNQFSPYSYPVALAPPQPTVPNLYAAPPPLPPSQNGDVPANGDALPPTSASTTHSPVAPVQPTSTEYTLPEIVENRSAKSAGDAGGGGSRRFNFIPLQNHYLAPEENRPSYEVPNRPPSFGAGYFYPRPTATFVPTTSTTSTTTERFPRPIVVIDPTENLPPAQAPPQNHPVPLQPPATSGEHGYDYNVPVGPPFQLPTPSTPKPIYLPPDGRAAVESSATANTLRLRVHEMRCMQNSGGYFRAILKVDNFIGAAPTVDNDSNDRNCELKLARSYVVVDIAESDFEKCGVHACGKDLCLRLRFPSIRGMRTSADGILTLHCKAQQRVAVKTHALKMSVSNEIQARSHGTYAHGGTQLPLRTHIELLRHAANGFTRQLDGHSAVLLGEELLLRAHVIAGDGWNYTKLTDVNVQRISPTGDLLNNVALITSHGCLNPSMQSICSQPPSYDPPLGHRLTFKAVMFQGMRSGDELVLSMRITACLQSYDCNIDADSCSGAGNLWRRKRNTSAHMANGTDAASVTRDADRSEVSEITRIAFRVLMPNEERKEDKVSDVNVSGENKDLVVGRNTAFEEDNQRDFLMEFSAIKIVSAVSFVVVLTCLGIFAAVKLTK